MNTKCYSASFEALAFIYCHEGFACTTGFRLNHSSDGQSIVAYSARRPHFCRTSVRVGLVVDKVGCGQVYFTVFRFSTCKITPLMLHINSRRFIPEGWNLEHSMRQFQKGCSPHFNLLWHGPLGILQSSESSRSAPPFSVNTHTHTHTNIHKQIIIIIKSMAMWGNHIQRVKIVINENITEQVTYFKYLGYCIS